MADELVLVGDDAGVRTLVLNRPDRLNAFNQAMFTALTTALADAADDDSIRVVVLTGAGRAFSAGADVGEMSAGARSGGEGRPEGRARFERFMDELTGFPKPLLCAVNGVGVGLGATLLGFADLVFMAESARLMCPFTKLALAPEAASSVTFPVLLGRQAATWLLLGSEWIDAAEAASMGLAWKVVPDAEVLEVAQDHARRLAGHPLSSLVASKRLIWATLAGAVAEGRQRESAAFDLLLQSDDYRAAVAAVTT